VPEAGVEPPRILIVERVRHDEAIVGIHRQMRLAVATVGLHAVFLFKLVARANTFMLVLSTSE
jgi:hypothetical protein